MKKLLSILSVMTILVTFVSACGKKAQKSDSPVNRVESTAGKETAKNEPTTGGKKETEKSGSKGSVFTEEFLFLENFEDVMKTFKEFGYVYNTKKEGAEATQWSFHWISLGKEIIDGVETEHLKITLIEKGETKENEGWYDTTKWEAVKFKSAKKGELTGLDAAFEGAYLGMTTQLYCNMLRMVSTVIQSDGTVDEAMYNMKKRSAGESIDLGEGTVQIELYDIEEKLMGFDKLYGLTKMGGKWMYTVIETINKKQNTLDGLRITRAVLR